MTKIIFWTACIGVSCVCIWWSSKLVYQTYSEKAVRKYVLRARESRALEKDTDKTQPIMIGLALSQIKEDKNSQGILNGIRIAAKVINSNGGILGHRVNLVIRDDEKDIKKAMQVAQELSSDTNMTAVIGHRYSSICDSVSVMYEYYGLPNITPTASAGILTNRGFKYNAQACLSDDLYAGRIAEFIERKKYRKIVMFNVLDTFGKGFRKSLEAAKEDHNFTIEAGIGFAKETSMESIKQNFLWTNRNFDYDAIILIGHTNQITQLITNVRQAGIQKPIITLGTLDENSIESISEYVDNTYVISDLSRDRENALYAELHELYTKDHKTGITSYVAGGFNSLYILKLAIESAGTLQPSKFAAALRKLKGSDVNGSFSYQSNGTKVSKVTIRHISEGGVTSVVGKF